MTISCWAPMNKKSSQKDSLCKDGKTKTNHIDAHDCKENKSKESVCVRIAFNVGMCKTDGRISMKG